MSTEYKDCKKCGQTKPVNEFYKNDSITKDGELKYSDRLQWQCIECSKKYTLGYDQMKIIKMQEAQIKTLEAKLMEMCKDCPGREYLYKEKRKTQNYVVNNDGTVSICR